MANILDGSVEASVDRCFALHCEVDSLALNRIGLYVPLDP